MLFDKSFKQKLFHLDHASFEEVALKLFKFQAQHNQVYNEYLSKLNISAGKINDISKIPFLPISFFKTHRVQTGNWLEEHVFESSGTTNSINSKNLVKSLEFYREHSSNIFKSVYSDPSQFHIMALLPSYLERDNSSLVFMVENLIRQSNSLYSGFYLKDYEKLVEDIDNACKSNKQILLIGVTFGLLDFIEHHQVNLNGHIVMETGGMKGRRKEMVREEVHKILKKGFNVQEIHSEYGMTELMSQAYATHEGLFKAPKCMRVTIRDPYDPFNYSKKIKHGGINVIDLANFNTCSFIETADIGRIKGDFFEVLGRFDNSEVRGCNLMM